jgi:3-hydroxyisobutyrate dehydrogenase-like beta-hydroxyacid dehydrogenase
VTSAKAAADAFRAGRPGLRPGALWADLNTASPGLKRELASIAEADGVPFADVAMMAPVPGRGLRVPMLASVDGTARHAVRRTAEMEAAAQMLTELGVPPVMADASRALHERLSGTPHP